MAYFRGPASPIVIRLCVVAWLSLDELPLFGNPISEILARNLNRRAGETLARVLPLA